MHQNVRVERILQQRANRSTTRVTAKSSKETLSRERRNPLYIRLKIGLLSTCHGVRAGRWSAILGTTTLRTGETKASGHGRAEQAAPEGPAMGKVRADGSVEKRSEPIIDQVQFLLRARTDSRRAAQSNGVAHNEEADPEAEKVEFKARTPPIPTRSSAQGVPEGRARRKTPCEDQGTSRWQGPNHGFNQLPRDDVLG